MSEVKQVVETLQKEWVDYTDRHDVLTKNVDSIKSEYKVEFEKRDTALDALQKQMDQIDLEAKRANLKGANGESPEAMEHKNAYNGYLRKGRDENLGELQEKALSIGVNADGGYAVPETLDTNILQLERDASVMRRIFSQMTVGNESYRKLVNLHGTASGWVGEAAARTETGTSQFGQITPVFGEIYANPATTQKMLDDAFFNVESWISSEVALQFAEAEDAAFYSGNGTDKPSGLMNAPLATTGDDARALGTLQNKETASIGAVDADDLIDLVYMIKAGYRGASQFLCSTNTLAAIRKLKDSQNQYLWQPSVQAGEPSQVLGYGVVESNQVADIANSANSVLFGDYKKAYKILDVRGTRILRDPFTNKPYVHFYTTKRVGGLLEDSQAVKVLTVRAV